MGKLYEKKISFEGEFLNEFTNTLKLIDSPKYNKVNIRVNANAIAKNYIAIITSDLDTLTDYVNDLYAKCEHIPNLRLTAI